MLDAHADSYQEERVPTWEAAVLADERARRAGCPVPAGERLPDASTCWPAGASSPCRVRPSGPGWAPLELLDARDEDPRAGGYPTRLASVIRAAVASEPGPARGGGAQPQGPGAPSGLRALPEPAAL